VIARIWYSQLLSALGRSAEAIQEARRASEIDPLSVSVAANLAFVFYSARRYEEAISAAKKAMEIDPNYRPPCWYLSFAYAAKNQISEAIEPMEKAAAILRDHTSIEYLGWIYALAGRNDDARQILDELKQLSERTYVSPYCFAFVYFGLGDLENWRKMMEAAFDERNTVLVYLKSHPIWDSVRSDPFFQEFIRKIGLL